MSMVKLYTKKVDSYKDIGSIYGIVSIVEG